MCSQDKLSQQFWCIFYTASWVIARLVKNSNFTVVTDKLCESLCELKFKLQIPTLKVLLCMFMINIVCSITGASKFSYSNQQNFIYRNSFVNKGA
jgi:ribosome biogenesis protein Nip4